VWDLHYPPPPGMPHEYPISAVYRDTPPNPLGPVAPPGQYTVKLTVGGKTYSQPLTIRLDPRVKTAPIGITQQFTTSFGIWTAMNSNHAAMQEIRALRAKLRERQSEAQGEIVDKLAALDKKVGAIEGAGGGGRRGGRGAPSEESDSLSRVNNELNTILGLLTGAQDSTPTSQAMQAAAELEKAADALRARWAEIRSRDIPALNADLHRAALTPLP
jgi:hypothetical protein